MQNLKLLAVAAHMQAYGAWRWNMCYAPIVHLGVLVTDLILKSTNGRGID